jgi:hypothetical protein
MKPISHHLPLYKSKQFKNLSIVIGICLSFGLFTTFQVDQSFISDFNVSESRLINANTSTSIDEVFVQDTQVEKNSTKYHNFLASYFLQESSKERKSKRSEEKGQIISSLRDFRNVIISRGLALF